jgi:hypothetical protein
VQNPIGWAGKQGRYFYGRANKHSPPSYENLEIITRPFLAIPGTGCGLRREQTSYH